MGRRRWIILPYIEGHIGPFREIYLSSIRGTNERYNYEIKDTKQGIKHLSKGQSLESL
jgi:hypothetical protein